MNHRLCACGHSQEWHAGGKHRGACHAPHARYGQQCQCDRFKLHLMERILSHRKNTTKENAR